jgi:hypothetical protein
VAYPSTASDQIPRPAEVLARTDCPEGFSASQSSNRERAMGKLRPRLTFANVVSVIALFVALGGASYAAVKLPKNSVGTKQLKKNSVNGAKVKDNSLTGSDIDEATLGVVPTATQANNAAQASQALNAQSLGGVPAAQFYSKSESDRRFLGGSGRVMPIPLVAVPNGNHAISLAEIAGVGKLAVRACAIGNTGFTYTNESNVTQNYVMLGAVNGINNSVPKAGTLVPGASYEYSENASHDLTRMSIAGGAKVLEFTVAQSREGELTCLYWGSAYSSG